MGTKRGHDSRCTSRYAVWIARVCVAVAVVGESKVQSPESICSAMGQNPAGIIDIHGTCNLQLKEDGLC